MIKSDKFGALMELGYTSKWIEYGVLSWKQLERDLVKLHQPDSDLNTEHYRYKVLIEYVNTKSKLSNAELDHLLELIVQDPDPYMTHSFVMVHLLKRDVLTDDQFLAFGEHILASKAEISKVYLNCDLLRRLRQDGLTPDVITRCIDVGDGEVQRKLLECTNLPRDAVQALAERGANKAVRNIAAERLRSKRYTKTAQN
jgi:hypothetical protein